LAIQRTDWFWKDSDARALDAAADKFVNYTRLGDGIVVDRATKLGKRESLGKTIWLDAIDERGLAADERAGALRAQQRYIANHSLRSMYHPDFFKTLDQVLTRRR
jgi:hypothetical protein